MATPDSHDAQRRSTSRLDGAAALLTGLSIALIFAISPMVLARAGLAYETSGGSVLHKVHPGTWVALIALGLVALHRGVFRLGGEVLALSPGLAVFAATWLLLFAYVVLARRGLPLTPIIDTFLLPIVLFPLIAGLGPSAGSRIALMLHALFTANALVGVAEFTTGWRLSPYIVAGSELAGDWRSTAIFGHPLANASLAGTYVLALAVGGGRDLPALARPVLIGLQLAAMVAFGGRAAVVILIALLAALLLLALVRFLAGGRLRIADAAGAILVVPLVGLATLGLIDLGFFDRFAERFVSDGGSARARLVMFRLLERLAWEDILLGPDPGLIATRQWIEGLDFGIESFWVGFVLLYGLLVSAIFFIGLAALCREILRATRPGAALALVYFFVVASTSLSLSAKSPLLGMTVAVLLVLLRDDGSAWKHRFGTRTRAGPFPSRAAIETA